MIKSECFDLDEFAREAKLIARIVNRRMRRTKRFNSKGARDRQFLIKRDGDKCAYCLLQFNKTDYTVDHVFSEAFCRINDIPRALWDHLSNKVLACKSCNQLKSLHTPRIEEYYAWLDRLINTPFVNAAVIELAKQFIERRTFVLPFISESTNPMLDKFTLSLDSSY